MKNVAKIAAASMLLLTLAACAAGTAESHTAVAGGVLTQLVVGFWHGLIAPITLLVEIFNKLVPGVLPVAWRLYETSNPSVPYDVGFYLGLAGGPGVFLSRRRRLRR